MAVRFRIRTPSGQELSFGSLEMFTEFVRSGELAVDDLVYDGETGEWAPARTHPLVLQVEAEGGDAGSGAERGGTGSSLKGGGTSSRSPSSAGELGLELAPEPDAPSREQAVAAFKAKMDAERAFEFDDTRSIGGLRMGSGASGLLEGIEAPTAPATEPAGVVPRPWRRRVEQAADIEAGHRPLPAKARRHAPRRGGGRALVLALGGAAIIALVYVGPGLAARIGGWATGAGEDAGIARPIPDTEEALRARAEERFLASSISMLRALPAIPRGWLDGAYLAQPSAYPQIREVWERYLTTIREVRSTEVERFRAAYLRALDDANVEGPTRTLRLTSASTAFLEEAPRRETHYARVERLAAAAIELHDDLTAIEGSITHEPAGGPGVSADPVLEAAGVDADAQAILDGLLDEVVDALDADGVGPRETAAVRRWVWDAFRETVGAR